MDVRIRSTAIAATPLSVGQSAAADVARRWSELARRALTEVIGNAAVSGVPLVIGSSNGIADGYEPATWLSAFDVGPCLTGTPWAGQSLPVFSGSCASGLQALWWGTWLIEAGQRDVIVLAVDGVRRASQQNFASLRLLSARVRTPWQADSEGFVTGEAAVAVWLTRATADEDRPRLVGPVLSQDLAPGDGLARVLTPFEPIQPTLLIGQGTGPAEADDIELSAFAATVDPTVPVFTPWPVFGHTLGASGLLSVALAARWQQDDTVAELANSPPGSTRDGRPFAAKSVDVRRARIACRALIGACAACDVTSDAVATPETVSRYETPSPPVAIMLPALQQLAREALRHRPDIAPDALLIRLDAPLLPPERALIGGRLLPTAVYEVTPGFVAQLTARCWGLTGGAMTLVGSEATWATSTTWIEACRQSGVRLHVVDITTADRPLAVYWNV
ncbi:MAG TPA: hypothetical protein VM165_22575 [Planctomycetaceae bacterium]|nr:hypothetical protein [Planctomycetaceae bacterium]